MGKYSRDKGKRGELDVKNKLGGSAKRTGHAFQAAPDVTTNFAAYSIKNKTIGGGAILTELRKLQALEPGRHHYVVFKPKWGVWVVAELVEQHVGDHGDDELHYGLAEPGGKS
ncbi:MAG: hypothetical protein Q8N90_01415 [bacterium]|nr:hypothetical protein [bacterium]